MKLKAKVSISLTPFLVYGYKFDSTVKLCEFLEKLIELRVPNNYIPPNKMSNECLKELYDHIDFNSIDLKDMDVEKFFYTINAYYYPQFFIDIIRIGDIDDVIVIPCNPCYMIDLLDVNETSFKKLTKDIDYSLSRNLIYFMENNGFDYIAKELDWHYLISMGIDQ